MPFRVQVVTTGYVGAPGYMNFYTGSILVGDVSTWITGLDAFIQGMRSVTANNVTISRSGDVEQFDPATGQTTGIVGGAPLIVGGTWGTAQSPPGTALVLRWRTGQYINGREVRGRTFWSGCGDFGDAAGLVPSSIITDAQGAQGDYLSTTLPAVYSPTNGTTRVISDASTWNMFGLIRSRRD